MTRLKKTIREIVKKKNEIIRAEREKLEAAEWSNRILSAYIALLARDEELMIKRDDVSELIGGFRASVSRTDDHYIIRLESISQGDGGKREGSGE